MKIFQEELQHLELYRYNIKTKKAVQILANKTVYDFAISPDGSKVVAAVTNKNIIDDEYMFKKIHIIDLENGKILKKLDNQGKLGKMVWSPDGKQIAFVAASGLHDAVCGSLFIMNVENQNEKYENLINIVKGLELSVKDVIWENNNTLLFTSEESGISNQVSKRNTTDIPLEDYLAHWRFWTHENMEKVWKASPIKYANGSKTATLILHGEEDTRIPTSQGKELYTALKLHGDAPVRLILYPGEGHGNAKNINRYDFLVRTLDWFDFYLIKNPGSKELPGKYINYE